jgi:hypothetical protein|tara:strand:- start:632 stop:1207 length:576 start_codon:yes stop_codon:yes gene_type:complete
MTTKITQFKIGSNSKVVVDASDIPSAWLDDVNAVFDNVLVKAYCMEAANPRSGVYEFYLVGGCERSLPIPNTTFFCMHKKSFNTMTSEILTEVYYHGYAFEVPESLKAQPSLSYNPATSTSIKYDQSGTPIERSYYLFRGMTEEPEFDRVVNEMGLTGSHNRMGAVKVNFDGDTPVDPCYYVWEAILPWER